MLIRTKLFSHLWLFGLMLIVGCSPSLVGEVDRTFQSIWIENEGEKVKLAITSHLPQELHSDRHYHWFSKGEIRSTKGGFSGHLLDGEILSYFKDGSLKKKGVFENGLKTKTWMSWYQNGEINTKCTYKLGLKHGHYIKYDSLGSIVEEYEFEKGLIHVDRTSKNLRNLSSDSLKAERTFN